MATAKPLFLNGWSTTLASSVANGTTTSFSLTSTSGLPTPGTDEYIPAMVVDTSTSPETIKEFVYITAVGSPCTVVRAAEDAGTYAAAALASGLTVAAVTTRASLTQRSAARELWMLTGGAIAETFPRMFSSVNSQTFTSGVTRMQQIILPVDTKISNIAFAFGNTGASPTHWWFGLWDNNLNLLARTADQTTTAISSNGVVSLAISTVASGSASSFTTTYTGRHYISPCVTASPMPTLDAAASGVTVLMNSAPHYVFESDSFGAPPSFPYQASLDNSPRTTQIYGYVS